MLRNYLATALRHLARNRLYSAISIIGLAVGLCGALMAALVIESELRYDTFLPDYEQTYLAVTVGTPPGHAPFYYDTSSSRLAPILRLYSNEVHAVARVALQEVQLRHGAIKGTEQVYWADPNIFDVLPLPTFAGDLVHALERPDAIVLTRSLARKYFGHEDARGQTLMVEPGHPMTVRAVIEDLPATELQSGIFASGLASYSVITREDRDPINSDASPAFAVRSIRTYLRVSGHRPIEAIPEAMPDLITRLWPHKPSDVGLAVQLVRFDAVHAFPAFNPGQHARLALTGIVGVLVLFVASINFVNLYTARSATRAREVAIRKVAGADRRTLVVQFVGESFAYVALACLLGVVLAEWGLPYVNAFLHTSVSTDWWLDPMLLASMVLGAAALGVLVSAYPALVLSSFRPSDVLRGLRNYLPGSALARESLVTLQFAVLIGLMIVAGVVWDQHRFATSEALRVDTDQMLIIRSSCNEAFVTELRALPGVRGASCSGRELLGGPPELNSVARPGADLHSINMVPVETAALELYGITPVAGSLRDSPVAQRARYILNQTAVREIGFASPLAAVGQTLQARPFGARPEEDKIIAVVPDFSLSSVENPVPATAYYVPDPRRLQIVNVKLRGRDVPETLAAIDRLWLAAGAPGAIDRFFLNDHIQNLYVSLLREAQAFAVSGAVTLLLACLGLLGLSASIAERRTREIGIRKATGAATHDIVRLLLFQFGKPAAWANVLAWPIAAYAMSRWLRGFAYHTHLEPWLFVGSAALALVIALLTVSTHSILVARSRTASALRCE
jgi:putative ABC transport system permease protein